MRIADGKRFSGIAKMMATLLTGTMSAPKVPSLYSRYSYGRPSGKALRNPKDPIQQARIQAAAGKRDRKEWLRDRYLYISHRKNAAHQMASNTFSLDPLFIAR
ncbi:hypothetical protein NAV33_07400 [Pseudomonas stutzeri]|uniref:hypothetical protein n=1 Tax=Stutzerimonas stutzeri TaxID=316 RepID=UPI00210D8FD0|nr:hypothetical protein [Stutzerimonas stutzeri]MCQ4311720.1 hypothetical protein [Stutzerimonas stutzeri]